MSLRLEQVNFKYDLSASDREPALKDINLEIHKGEFVGIIGHTGSGKSTLVQHFNGLLRPTKGTVTYEERNIHEKGYPLAELRKKIGLVFQYPENQIFENSIFTEVAFGLQKLKLDAEELKRRVQTVLAQVGLSDISLDQHPTQLSGGQKRRVAIASVLIMEPEMLVLDEPAVGLDPEGRDSILGGIATLSREEGLTVVLVSHSMEIVAQHCQRIIVMDRGSVALDGTAQEVYSQPVDLERIGLTVPSVVSVLNKLRERGFNIDTATLDIEDAKRAILRAVDLRTSGTTKNNPKNAIKSVRQPKKSWQKEKT
jgi:energy-coupling factor transport system ATP-binding protein